MKDLILVPTAFEMSFVQSDLEHLQRDFDAKVKLCGFGAIGAAAATTEHLIRHRPQRVVLIGLAGGFPGCGLEIGEAYRFHSAVIDGIGVGQGHDFRSAGELGWRHWPGDEQRPEIADEILFSKAYATRRLLTVCAASGSLGQAVERQRRYLAAAEEMEGFSVALACQQQATPLEVIRGISNQAGDRDKNNWQIEAAMRASVQELAKLIIHG